MLRVVGEAIAAVDPDPEHRHTDDIADLVDAYIAFVTGSPDLARIYLQIAVSGALADGALHKRVVGHHEQRVQRFAAALRRRPGRASDGDEEAAAELLLATLNGLAFRWALGARVRLSRSCPSGISFELTGGGSPRCMSGLLSCSS